MKEQASFSKALDINYPIEAFERVDESDDRTFYATDRFVEHLDEQALQTVEKLIESLVVEEKPVILDLMAGWSSHLPESLAPERVVGLGLNENELAKNPALKDRVIHDLNIDPNLPFPDDTFDVVMNTVSVDYMTQPFEVFADVERILKPGGLYLVIFSNRFFPEKVIKIWKGSSEEERVLLVLDYFRSVEGFESPRVFVSQGKARPEQDHYAGLGIPSDPIYAVYAEKKGGAESAERGVREARLDEVPMPDDATIARRKAEAAKSLGCPYCGERMKKWEVPQTPFTEWDVEFMYICFNDTCPYLVRGWNTMNRQGNSGYSLRAMYIKERDSFSSVPVQSLKELREFIVDEQP
ncbi:MAG: methyltransferase domain-containing protein [Planctomycetota bacterium]|jgi:SAM-dependent methyltransferase